MSSRMFRIYFILTLWMLSASMRGQEVFRATNSLRSLPLKNIRVTDEFWAPKLRIYKDRTIPHSWKYMAGELRALRAATGEQIQGELNGTWGEANLYKFLETVAHSLGQFPDPELEMRVDEIVEQLAKAQQQDGFIHLFYINSKKPKWDE